MPVRGLACIPPVIVRSDLLGSAFPLNFSNLLFLLLFFTLEFFISMKLLVFTYFICFSVFALICDKYYDPAFIPVKRFVPPVIVRSDLLGNAFPLNLSNLLFSLPFFNLEFFINMKLLVFTYSICFSVFALICDKLQH